MHKKRGQASLEYVLIVGFALMMLIPTILLFGYEKNNIKDQANMIQSINIANKVVEKANVIHFLGEPTMTTITVNIPKEIDHINITEDDISFHVNKDGRLIEITSTLESTGNMTGFIKSGPGLKDIVIKAENGYINISSD